MHKRFGIRTLLVATLLIAICCATFVMVRQSFVGRVQVAQRLETLIDGLYTRQPSNLNAAQWRCMVDWTRSLHGNSLIAYQTTTTEINVFERRLEEQLSGDVDAGTIEWIWDEYAKVCRGGKNYQRFRVAVNEDLAALNSPALLEPPGDEYSGAP